MQDPRAVPAAHSMDTAWFGVDADGNLALFDTGEAGAFPEDAVGFGDYSRPLGGSQDGFAAICEAVRVSEDIWEEDAAPTVFRYSHEDDNWIAGRYVRQQAPVRPARIEEVPAALRGGIVKLPVRFAAGDVVQPVEHVPCDAWGPIWLSADGKVARPFPGRESEADEEWENIADDAVRFERDPGVARKGTGGGGEGGGAGGEGGGAGGGATADEGGATPPKKPWWKFW